MRYLGHEDARTTGAGADGGIDVYSRSALGQVKARQSATSRPELQRLLGAAGRRQVSLYFFSTGGYTRDALTWADEMGIAAFTLTGEGLAIPNSSIAKTSLHTADRGSEGSSRGRIRVPAERAATPRIRGWKAVLLCWLAVTSGVMVTVSIAAAIHLREFTEPIWTVLVGGVVGAFLTRLAWRARDR
ncbi:restriction endonuclease [uncultured Cellulomonas sp.]|uniref:restriction endonuclease n=1 Tax=uncultured Cellulomonas sp. TaxID=189682 RepID=UPI00345C275C